MSTRSSPLKASIAAPPVSPEVAPTMVAPRRAAPSTWSISRPSSCIATSLKASVGPWKSSSTKRLSPICVSGQMAGCAEPGRGLADHLAERLAVDIAIGQRADEALGDLGIAAPRQSPRSPARRSAARLSAHRARHRGQARPEAHREKARETLLPGGHMQHGVALGDDVCCYRPGSGFRQNFTAASAAVTLAPPPARQRR